MAAVHRRGRSGLASPDATSIRLRSDRMSSPGIERAGARGSDTAVSHDGEDGVMGGIPFGTNFLPEP